MELKELKQIATPYFKNSNVSKLYITDDRQVFYEDALGYAKSYVSGKQIQINEITREQFEEKTPDIVECNEAIEQEVKKEPAKRGRKKIES